MDVRFFSPRGLVFSVIVAGALYLEKRYGPSLKTERVAFEGFRAFLQNKSDRQSQVQRFYCICYATLLTIPVIRIILFLSKSFFCLSYNPINSALNHLLENKKIN